MRTVQLLRGLANERGVALPLALMGLVAVSLLVTTALVTSSNEVALSSAHQRGAQGLYRADAALEGFIASRASMPWSYGDPPRLASGTSSYTLADGTEYWITAAKLAQATTETATSASRVETFSLLAEPASGRGRSVVALIRASRLADQAQLNINSGLTLGVNTTVTGNATISDGSDGAAGCSTSTAQSAVTYGSDNTVSVGGSAQIVGDTTQSTLTGAALISQVFNGKTVNDLVQYANIRFGPRFGQSDFNNSIKIHSSNTNPNYRWGCPANLMLLASLTCPAGTSGYFPIVAIDANGGVVDITGDHGQGTLIVVNGTLRIRGNFLYEGIIISEGVTQILGTPRIEGAVITMGSEAVIDPDDSATTSGTSVIRYNLCAITSAQAGLALGSLDYQRQDFENRTTGWFEVVR